jgi:hypothetical protein
MQDTTATSRRTALRETADLASLGLAAAAAAVRNGDITSETYATALLQRARALAELNAFITIDEAAVLAAAKNADKARSVGSAAPLLGVPLGVKDSYLTAGLPTTLGLDRLAHFIPREDADAVRAIKDAGAIVFGKNNLVEMSYGLTGHNEALRAGEEPARPQSRNRRLLKRLCRIRGCRDRSRLPGWGYGRLDPGAGIVLWRRGIQANHRTLAAQRRCANLPYARHDGRIRPKRRGLHFGGSGRDW